MKRVIYILLLAILIISIVIGCSKSDEVEKSAEDRTSVVREVKVATLDGLPTVSVAKLYNETPKIKEGYETRYIINDDKEELLNSLLEFNVDIAIVTPDIAARAYNQNGKYKIMGTIGMNPYYFVSNEEGVNSISDLKNKEVVNVTYGDANDDVIQITLNESGVNSDDIEMKTINIMDYYESEPNMISEIEANKPINAFVPEPVLTTLLNDNPERNIRVVKGINDSWKENYANSKGCPQYTIVVRDDFLNTNNDFVNSFVGQVSTSTDWAIKNPEDTNKYIKEMDVSPKLRISKETLDRSNLKYTPINNTIADYNNYYKKVFSLSNKLEDERVPDDSIYYIGD
ncbi:ABC transporter substrate-binding protein [Metaclostridioides mangenotii]|uniref:NitT/TauT family transport system substrate-binding protein n=1 Tax=Metaclostridioides mangenotii TaxID=1540 RepID=A0ABS4ED06_9FIRM|nr:ABC transporter substrate-binding protein [Clostridioides mangenotii]MBP1855814.1 NitT/TauT family transport system substrate-binding protein [Clostridioides mangenotii]